MSLTQLSRAHVPAAWIRLERELCKELRREGPGLRIVCVERGRIQVVGGP